MYLNGENESENKKFSFMLPTASKFKIVVSCPHHIQNEEVAICKWASKQASKQVSDKQVSQLASKRAKI